MERLTKRARIPLEPTSNYYEGADTPWALTGNNFQMRQDPRGGVS